MTFSHPSALVQLSSLTEEIEKQCFPFGRAGRKLCCWLQCHFQKGLKHVGVVTGRVQGLEQGKQPAPEQLLVPIVSIFSSELLPSLWLFCLAVPHARAIVVVLDFENVASFRSCCFRSCKHKDVVGKAYLGGNYCAVSCLTYSLFSFVV